MAVKMNFRIITKNQAADPEIGFLTKLLSKPYGLLTAVPLAWELKSVTFVDEVRIETVLEVNITFLR